MKHSFVTLIAAVALASSGTLGAQTFPSKPITIVVPASPGGAIDLAARLIGQKMTESWGQSVVTDKKAGAGRRHRAGRRLAATVRRLHQF